MFDRTFFKFALGFTAIILFGMGALLIAGYIIDSGESQTAATRP